jgi:phenylacetate-coenzyme A ligase PaaK-like adenylate-forming protein
MLVAYASMDRLLAEEQLAGRLQIAPRRIFSASEVLTDEARKRIETAWGRVLFNEYAATESGSLAAEDPHHQGLSLFEDQVIFEVVDERNQPVPPGTYGEKVLLTVLFNHTQPLIRYELSDSVRLAATPDPAGRPYRIIDGIQGRREDILIFPAGQGGTVTVHPNVFHALLDTVPVSGWQIIQEASGLKVLLSGVREGFSKETFTAALQQALVTHGVLPQAIQVQQVAAIPRKTSGKAPLITSTIHRPAPPNL